MALIKCPECGNEKVSDRAKKCPSCGFPLKSVEEEGNKKIVLPVIIIVIAIITLLAIGLIVYYFAFNNNTSQDVKSYANTSKDENTTSSNSNSSSKTQGELTNLEDDKDVKLGGIPNDIFLNVFLGYSFKAELEGVHFYSNNEIGHYSKDMSLENEDIYGTKYVKQGFDDGGLFIYTIGVTGKYTYYYRENATSNCLYVSKGWILDVDHYNPVARLERRKR